MLELQQVDQEQTKDSFATMKLLENDVHLSHAVNRMVEATL